MPDIAFVIGNLNREHGGAQQLLYDICRHLPADFDTTVYHMFGEGTYRDAFEATGTAVVDLDAASNYDPRAFARLVRTLRNASHDILHTNSPISGAWGRVAGTLAGVPGIVSVEHNVHGEYDAVSRLANGTTLPLADAVVGVTEAVSESYLWWEDRLLPASTRRVTIRNGVDVAAIESEFGRADEVLAERTPFDATDTIVGTVGRLHEQKGYEHLLGAVPSIKERMPDAKLLVIGDGPRRERLERRAERTGHADDIHFTGYVESVYPFLPAFDVAAFPSLWEGFGLTPVEAMVAKRPVIGSDIPAFREVIGDAGVLVEPADERALADAIVQLLADETERRELGQRGYDRAVSEFSIERTVQEYADLYHRVADE